MTNVLQTGAPQAGQQPRCMSLLWFQRNPLPTDGSTRGGVSVRCLTGGLG